MGNPHKDLTDAPMLSRSTMHILTQSTRAILTKSTIHIFTRSTPGSFRKKSTENMRMKGNEEWKQQEKHPTRTGLATSWHHFTWPPPQHPATQKTRGKLHKEISSTGDRFFCKEYRKIGFASFLRFIIVFSANESLYLRSSLHQR